MRKVVITIGAVLLILNVLPLGAGAMFKIMHWPLANEMLITGIMGLGVGLIVLLVGMFLVKKE